MLDNLVKFHDLHLDLFYDPQLKEIGADLARLPFFNSANLIPPDGSPTPKSESLYNDKKEHDYVFVTYQIQENHPTIDILLHLNGGDHQEQHSFGGHPALYPLWAKNYILSFSRETIIQEKGDICKK